MKKRVHIFLSFFLISILSMHGFYMVAFATENLTTLENQKSLYVEANVDGETSENSVYAKEERNIQDKTTLIAEEFAKNDFEVMTGLMSQKTYYENLLLLAESDDEISKIENLIDTTQKLITENQQYQQGLVTMGSTAYPEITIAVSAVISYFELNGNKLAAELLSHALANSDLDSNYYPINKNGFLLSSTYMNLLTGNSLYGSGEFKNAGNANDIDLFRAIHNFNYTKSYRNSYMVTMVLSDRYDYELGEGTYNGIPQMAVDMMATAQDFGVIVPFYTTIFQDVTGTYAPATINILPTDRYTELFPAMRSGGYMDFNITFASTGYRVIQSFAKKDAYLEIYDVNGALVISNDDNGYSFNALINYNFQANVQYRLKVRYFSSNSEGEIKIGICPINSSSFIKYEDIYQPFNGPYSIYTSTAPNSVTLAMFTPTTTGNYTITTESTADMYLYLVDPRTMKPRIHNDDDGGNSQPKISTKFVEGVPYMIIISRYAISESSVMIALKIVKN